MADPTEPRTRATRMMRDLAKVNRDFVGADRMPLTCPRCGWPCTHLVRAYWESPWNQHGGICHECVLDAVAAYTKRGWPDDPLEAKPEKVKPQAPAPKGLFDDA